MAKLNTHTVQLKVHAPKRFSANKVAALLDQIIIAAGISDAEASTDLDEEEQMGSPDDALALHIEDCKCHQHAETKAWLATIGRWHRIERWRRNRVARRRGNHSSPRQRRQHRRSSQSRRSKLRRMGATFRLTPSCPLRQG